jgi:phage recombination protein Bet
MSANTNIATLQPKRNSLVAKFAERFSIDEAKVMDILKATAFKQRDGNPPSDDQMMALMVVADQYGLNPFTKEIYAYPDKQNGIVPVVGVDGWSRIMNEHPQLDGIEFNYSEETLQHMGKLCHVWIEVVITRKDRSKPIVVREYFDEVVRSVNFSTPWDSHPKRMHRHKTLIQGGRVAFGFAGIYDEDEAQRIIEKDITPESQEINPRPRTGAAAGEASQHRGEVFDPEQEARRGGLVTALEAFAKNGTDAFLAEWKKMGKANKEDAYLVGEQEYGRLLSIAQAADEEKPPVDDAFVSEMNAAEQKQQ